MLGAIECRSCGAKLQAAETIGACPRCGTAWDVGLSEAATIPPASTFGPRPGEDMAEAATLLPSGGALGSEPTAAGEGGAVSSSRHGFGDYELRQELARGGMGVVFRARQVSLGRDVALKMILSGSLAGPADVERFLLEAEAAAGLDHPNIVPIYEVGELDGQHFFSMKLVGGGSLAGEVHRLPDDLPEAARLVAIVARAVHYAHQRGILHRDLKPANILLDEQRQPHVTDFGLAKRVESEGKGGGDRGMTVTGAVLGTPGYMPPEQASGSRGKVTTASDVYGLGAVLYATITGEAPFRAASSMDILLLVLEKEPESPRKRNPKVDRDLETICLKCLEKDPARRYGSAEALAEELERWSAGEPILARPISSPERLAKWAKRRPAIAALVVLLIATAAAGVGGIVLEWRRAEAQKTLAIRAKEAAKAEARRADENYQQARKAVEDYLTRVSQSPRLKRPGLQGLRRELLGDALKYHEKFLAQHAEDPELRYEVANSYLNVGNIQNDLGENRLALASFERAAGLYETLAREHPERPFLRLWHGKALNNAGNARRLFSDGPGKPGPTDLAREYYRRSAEVAQAYLAGSPGDVQGLTDRAISMSNVAKTFGDVGRLAECRDELVRLRDFLKDATAKHPESLGLLGQFGDVQHRLGDIASDEGRAADAEALYTAALQAHEARVQATPSGVEERSDLARICNELGLFLGHTGRPAKALPFLERGRDLREALLAEEPESADLAEYLARSYDNIGMHFLGLDRPDRAREPMAKCVEIRARLRRDQPDNPRAASGLGGAIHNLAMVFDGLGQTAQAEARYREAIVVEDDALKKEPSAATPRRFLANHLASLATLLRRDGRVAESLPLSRRRRSLFPGRADAAVFLGVELAQALVSPGPKDGAAGIDGDAVGKEAVEALAEAVRLGADRRVLARMPQLAPLRSREDFRALVSGPISGKN